MSLMHGGRVGADAQTCLTQGPGDGPASLHGPRRSGGGTVSADAACWGPSSGSSALSDGRASRPGSCPPANFTSAWTRESTEGWVANRSAKPSRGLSTHNSITAEVAPGSSPRFSILRSAEIMASGFFVNSTDPASASSSRERDSASRTSCDNSQASAISTIATMMTTMAAPPAEPFRSPSEEDDEDDDEEDDHDDPPPPELQLKLVNIRKNNSAKKPTTPAMITAITIICTSPLRMWVSSWPSTASISRSLSAFNRPVVTVMAYCRWLSPVANALSASLCMIFSFGIGMPREMQRFSSRL